MSERWQRLLADFEAAAALTGEERRKFLAGRRAEDPAAADELERMLAAETGTGPLDDDPRRLLDELVPPPAAGADAAASAVLDPTLGGPIVAAGGVPPVIGRYQVHERIGRGGFGDVYRGFDPVLKRAVAIKTCLVAELAVRQRFVREAELAARLVHPNIVTVHDFGTADEMPYLVQELLPGEDLAQRLARGTERDGDLPLAAKLRLLLDVAAGLAHAHAAGIVHRDVKPGNLRLLPDGRVKILDFGIARELGAASVLTGDDRAIGTLAYMAPEQARGELPDARADVHGWGAVAYELFSGQRAVPGDSPAAMLFRLLESSPPPLRQAAPETPAELAALVDRCLSRDPAKRPRDGGELLALLEPLARRLVPSAELAPGALPWSAPPPQRRGRRLAAWAAAVAVVVAAVLAARLAIRAAAEADAAPLAVRAVADGPDAGGDPAGAEAGGASEVLATGGATGGATPDAAAPAASLAPGPPVSPSPSGSETAPVAPPPALAAAPTGVLQVDARPWGELVRLVTADGSELPLPADAVTPLALTVPEGDYTVWLRHPRAPAERSCEAHVVAGGRALCRVELRALRAAELLGEEPPG